jgi:hypothetical protein
MLIKENSIEYSWFEVRMANLLMGRGGTFPMTTEPIHERKALWDEIQAMKKLAREETPEMAGGEL